MILIKRQIPNLFTLGNLLSGCFGIWMAVQQQIELSVYFLLLGVVFDFFDGFLARLLGVSSEEGKQLDSLADIVTFGVLPSFQAMWILENGPSLGFIETGGDNFFSLLGMILAPAAALRLAWFNVHGHKFIGFWGLPTPAMALVIGSIAWSLFHLGILHDSLASKEGFLVVLLFFSWIMNSKVKLIALKFKNVHWEGNQGKFLLLGISLVLLLFLNFEAFPGILVTYILISLFFKDKNEV
jgi:CDP-diacylglycerol---serine O-phosphatidyltransferase